MKRESLYVRILAGCLLILVSQVLSAPAQENPAGTGMGFTAGKEAEVRIPGSNMVMKVYLPLNYSPETNWPVIFFFHEKNMDPTTSPLKEYTGGKDYVIVGMPYVAENEIPKTQKDADLILLKELSNFRSARAWVGEHVRIDTNRVLMGGVGFGGWATGTLADYEMHRLAGMFVLLAGRQHVRITPAAVAAFKQKPIYIGAGEKDTNLLAALSTVGSYRRRGSLVAYEVYMGQGHDMPADAPPRFKAWLDAMAKWFTADHDGRLRREIDRDLKLQFKEAMALKDALARYNALADLEMNPRLLLCDTALADEIRSQVRVVKAVFPGSIQSSAENVFFDLLVQDSKIRNADQLKAVCDTARRLKEAFPDTLFGKLAVPYSEHLDNLYQRVLKTIKKNQPAGNPNAVKFSVGEGPVQDKVFNFKLR